MTAGGADFVCSESLAVNEDEKSGEVYFVSDWPADVHWFGAYLRKGNDRYSIHPEPFVPGGYFVPGKPDKDGRSNFTFVVKPGFVDDTFELIEKVIAPCIGKNDKRLLVAINQADIAMKGKHWDSENHKPDETLAAFLKEKEKSVHDRILNGCGISVDPISYSAGYKEEGCPQEPSYNMAKLLYYIIDSIPEEKRLQTYLEANADQKVWQSNDAEDYAVKIQQKLGWKHTMKSTAEGATLGAAIGSVIPLIGTAAGAVVGGVIGFIGSFFD